MKDEKINYLKSINNFNIHPEKIKLSLFKSDPFFDPHDKGQVKYEMLRLFYLYKKKVIKLCKMFGFSRETFYTILRAFQKCGIKGLLNEKKGRKRRNKVSLEISGFIILSKAKEPKLSGAQIAKMIKEKYHVAVSKKTVERELKKFGLIFFRRGYFFKEQRNSSTD